MSGSSSKSLRKSLGQELLYASVDGRILEVIALLIQGAPVNIQGANRHSPLMLAAQSGHLEIVQRLLDAGADHRLKNADGKTALSFAVMRRHEAIAELLLSAGADPDVVFADESISLARIAIMFDHPRMLEILLDGGASLQGYKMTDQLTNLAYAARANKPESVKILLNHGAKPTDTPEDGKHPLMLAAENGYTEIVLLLMGDVSRRPLSKEALRKGGNALWVAATSGQMDVVNCMLEMGIPVDSYIITESLSSETMPDATPLMAAILHGHLAVAKRLIAAGADVNWSRGENHPPLLMVIGECKVDSVKADLVKVLLDAGADVNHQCSDTQATALYLAAQCGYDEVIKVLLERGADFELANHGGFTPLFIAAGMGECAALALLLAAGADPNAFANGEVSPLMVAIIEQKDVGKCTDVMQQLLDAGADINAVDGTMHRTSLIIACSQNPAAVKYLLDHGAHLNVVSHLGTALHRAAGIGNADVVKLLLDAGADTTVKVNTHIIVGTHIKAGGETALQLAARFGKRNVVEVILAHVMSRSALG